MGVAHRGVARDAGQEDGRSGVPSRRPSVVWTYSRYAFSWQECATKVAPSFSPRSREIAVLSRDGRWFFC